LELIGTQASSKILHANAHSKFLDQDLDEDTRGRCGIILVEVDSTEHLPVDGIGRQKMTKELRDDAKSVGLVSMNRVVVFGEHFLEKRAPQAIELAEAFANQAEKFVVRPFLGATLNDHGRQFLFFAGG